ncbi:MAG: ankyrin repeat domain-containing protein [Blastocatellales bacterium]
MNNGNGEIAYFFNGDNRMLEITIDRQPIIEVSSGRLWSVDAYRGDPAEALLKALEDRDMTIMSKLLNSNPSLSNTTYSGGMTLLMFSDSPRVTRMALGAGADVNAKDINGSTPLHYAAYYGHIQIAELLIARKANVNAKNFFGNTPLHFAMSMGKEALGDYLIKCGADTSIRNSAGQTPLGIALDN